LRPGAPVAFRAADRNAEVRATVKTIGAIADERTRTVSVRAEFDDAQSDVGPGAVGVANVILRDEPQAVLVPAEAVHSDGDCKVVFVRDRRFGAAGAPAIFHVRQIRPGGAAAGNLEVAAGLLPGEYVAVAGSGVLRSELLKHNLGAG
jgi:cobalt-zinc-cadmium efflux system membrane fusion protein